MSSYITQRDAILTALALLDSVGLPTAGVRSAYDSAYERATRTPDEDDLRYPRTVPLTIDDHLTIGGDRPLLDSGAVVGRAYSLTPGQRDILRDWYSMTPTSLITVTGIDFFDGEHSNLIREIRLTSQEHLANNRRHLLSAVSITHWGRFCAAARRRDDERKDDTTPADKPAKSKSTTVRTLDLTQLTSLYGL